MYIHIRWSSLQNVAAMIPIVPPANQKHLISSTRKMYHEGLQCRLSNLGCATCSRKLFGPFLCSVVVSTLLDHSDSYLLLCAFPMGYVARYRMTNTEERSHAAAYTCALATRPS